MENPCYCKALRTGAMRMEDEPWIRMQDFMMKKMLIKAFMGWAMKKKEEEEEECSVTTEWLDEHSCPNGHLGGQFGCDFCNVGVVDKSGTNNLNEFLKEQGWDEYDIKKHYNLKNKKEEEEDHHY